MRVKLTEMACERLKMKAAEPCSVCGGPVENERGAGLFQSQALRRASTAVQLDFGSHDHSRPNAARGDHVRRDVTGLKGAQRAAGEVEGQRPPILRTVA